MADRIERTSSGGAPRQLLACRLAKLMTAPPMNWTLEMVPLPVSDMDSAVHFYSVKLGFNLDFDFGEGADRFAQLTPPGSGCSIQIRPSSPDGDPGSIHGLQLVVNDLRRAHRELSGRGVDVEPIQIYGKGGASRDATDDDQLDNVGIFHFEDPDGARWAVQQISSRP